ncbi:peptidylprolyl isomerase [Neoroseomonas soli]|uniref:Peptidyl-prolyl cis-trans isomerase n=1 Tax=Neoroseomonas soli TaxID=1081025 RepID=A0A9X9WW06_9PROT|nr:peptidylprolyl isomerase [Neoroseomonas soli]MBR0671335.1 peptidylprolyl isomerase [Neoroseomonas soli]
MNRRTLLGAAAAVAASPALAVVAASPVLAQQQPALDPENTLILELPGGRVTIQLLPDLAPRHVERVKVLARRGFYDNTPFHRVIEGFMAQGGDPTGTGTRGSDLPDLPAEFTPPSRARFIRGTVGAARTQNPNSANSQFFIMFAPAPSLDGQYTIWGRVVSGMDAVDKIKRGAPGSGTVTNPDRIRTARIAADNR